MKIVYSKSTLKFLSKLDKKSIENLNCYKRVDKNATERRY